MEGRSFSAEIGSRSFSTGMGASEEKIGFRTFSSGTKRKISSEEEISYLAQANEWQDTQSSQKNSREEFYFLSPELRTMIQYLNPLYEPSRELIEKLNNKISVNCSLLSEAIIVDPNIFFAILENNYQTYFEKKRQWAPSKKIFEYFLQNKNVNLEIIKILRKNQIQNGIWFTWDIFVRELILKNQEDLSYSKVDILRFIFDECRIDNSTKRLINEIL